MHANVKGIMLYKTPYMLRTSLHRLAGALQEKQDLALRTAPEDFDTDSTADNAAGWDGVYVSALSFDKYHIMTEGYCL